MLEMLKKLPASVGPQEVLVQWRNTSSLDRETGRDVGHPHLRDPSDHFSVQTDTYSLFLSSGPVC